MPPRALPLQVLHQALGDDRRYEFICLVDALAPIYRKTDRFAIIHHVADDHPKLGPSSSSVGGR
jgi:proline dehydrogenase